MLNLRLVQPSLILDITRIPELTRIEDAGDAVVLGACITHAAIEDERITDPSNGFLAEAARGNCLSRRAHQRHDRRQPRPCRSGRRSALLPRGSGAEVLLTGPRGRRRLALDDFVRGALDTELEPDEILDGVRIGKLSKGARAGFAKICRKSGEFADAIRAVVHDPHRGALRLVAGAMQGRPILIDAAQAGFGASWPPAVEPMREHLCQAGFARDAYELNIHMAALRRAVENAQAS